MDRLETVKQVRSAEDPRDVQQPLTVAEHPGVLVDRVCHRGLWIASVVRHHEALDGQAASEAVTADEDVHAIAVLDIAVLRVRVNDDWTDVRQPCLEQGNYLGE